MKKSRSLIASILAIMIAVGTIFVSAPAASYAASSSTAKVVTDYYEIDISKGEIPYTVSNFVNRPLLSEQITKYVAKYPTATTYTTHLWIIYANKETKYQKAGYNLNEYIIYVDIKTEKLTKVEGVYERNASYVEPEPEPAPEPTPEPEPEPEIQVSPVVKAPVKTKPAPETSHIYPGKAYSEMTSIYDVMLNMLVRGEMGTIDVTKLNTSYAEVNAQWSKILDGEGRFAYAAAKVSCPQFINKNGKQTVKIYGMDADYVNRYNALKAVVDKVKSMVKPGMSDLEKALIANEYVGDVTTYDANATDCGRPFGPLLNGRGLCAGYTEALNLLLSELGIENRVVLGVTQNHEWTLLKLDGSWYLADATWDDTRSLGKHYFFVRTIDEYMNKLSTKHYEMYVYNMATRTSEEISKYNVTNTKYTNWFAHSVKGTMKYYNGYWYYAEGSKLVRSKIDGSSKSTVLTAASTVTLVSISDSGIVTYKVGSTTKTTTVK